jgi:hypothetical protein
VFLLSPASLGGRRASWLFREQAGFDLALRLRGAGPVELGEVFAFLSGLYFRGKLAYARAFGRPNAPGPALVITPSRGLLPATHPATLELLREFASVPIDITVPSYRRPMERTVAALVEQLDPLDRVVLLGSVATGKYVDILTAALGERLLFPGEFVGRGDMSRGGLMLRCVTATRELEYVPVLGATRHGPRPARLEPIR